MENTIYCNNFAIELKSLLFSEFKNCKIIFVTNNILLEKYSKKINQINEVDVRLKIVTLPSFACNNKLFYNQLVNQLDEDTKLLVCFGSGNLCDIVKCVCSNLNLPYVVVPTMCSGGGYGLNTYLTFNEGNVEVKESNLYKLLIVDEEIISQTPNKMLASCYSEIMCSVLIILDAVFLKATKRKKINTQTLINLEKLITQTSTMPANIIKTPFGKVQLFKTYLKLNQMLNELNLHNASIYCFRNLTLKLLNKSVSCGAVLMVCALVLSSYYKQFFAIKLLNANIFPNIEHRVNKLKSVMHTGTIAFLNQLNFNVYKNVNDINLVKDICLKLSNNYYKIIFNAFSVFKNLHNDKGVYLQKIFTKPIIVNALCMAPDVYISDNLLTAIRNTGLLELNY